MLPREVGGLLLDYIPRLHQKLNIEKIYLYGSYSTGKFSKDSDVDIAIFLKDEDLPILQAYKTAMRLCRNYSMDVQPQVFSASELGMPIGIIEEVITYGRDITSLGSKQEKFVHG